MQPIPSANFEITQGPLADATQTSATITWLLSQGGTGQVHYGTTTAYGSTSTEETSYLTSHERTITSLTPGQQFHYKVVSVNEAAEIVESSDQTFTTPKIGRAHV